MLFLLLACLTTEDEYEALMDRAMDADGDGHIAAEHGGDDCNDQDPEMAPGLDESCDAKDNDCDSDVDEDASDAGTFYRDWDLDGFGDDAESLSACTVPEDYSELGGDCDDRDDLIHPAAGEVCDGIDNDCDSLVDDEDEVDLSSGSTYYIDNDGDGFGDDATPLQACEAPEGYVDKGGDCDDTVKKVNPWRAEVCGDGLDNDCSGGAPECGLVGEYKVSQGDFVIWGTEHQERFGESFAVQASTAGGEVDRLVIGAPGEGVSGPETGWIGAFELPLSGEPERSDADWSMFFDYSGEQAGGFLAPLGDMDGDGANELWIAGNPEDYTGTKAYILYDQASNSSANLSSGWGGFGTSAASFNTGEAKPSLAIGSPAYLYGTGAVLLWETAPEPGGTAPSADVTLKGRTEEDGVATLYNSISAGDFDGDGVDGLVVGAVFDSRAYLVNEVQWDSPIVHIEDSSVVVDGVKKTDFFGASPRSADVNGDGYADWVIGAPAQNSPDWEKVGFAYIFHGSAAPPTSLEPSTADTTIRGQDAGEFFGVAMAVGDTNADGNADLAVFQGLDDRESSVWIFADIGPGTVSTDSATAEIAGIRKAGCGVYGNLILEDVNQDGMADVIVGCADAGRSADALGDDEGMVSIILTQGL